MAVLRGFPLQGVVACFDEPNQTGDWRDIDAPRNAPAKDPGAYLSSVYWHSEFFQYELAMPTQTVDVNHPALAGRTISWGFSPVFDASGGYVTSGMGFRVPGSVVVQDHVLVQHDLGYPPLAFVAYEGRMLMSGVAVQVASGGRNRFVAPYVTSSVVGIREVRNSSESTLVAVTKSYQVMVFRTPAVSAGLPLFSGDGDEVIFGRGKVNTANTYARKVGAGATPFSMDQDRTVDLNNGRSRIATGGSVTTEAGYTGGFTAPPFIPVGV